MFENISQLRVDFLCDRSDARISDQAEHHRRLGRLDVHGAIVALEDVDIARKKDSDGRLGLQCPMRQRWVAGAKDEVGLALDPHLLLERRLDVNLGQDTEASRGQGLAHARGHLGDGKTIHPFCVDIVSLVHRTPSFPCSHVVNGLGASMAPSCRIVHVPFPHLPIVPRGGLSDGMHLEVEAP
jgi:hypothetical protein